MERVMGNTRTISFYNIKAASLAQTRILVDALGTNRFFRLWFARNMCGKLNNHEIIIFFPVFCNQKTDNYFAKHYKS